jgi:hypothetical protein
MRGCPAETCPSVHQSLCKGLHKVSGTFEKTIPLCLLLAHCLYYLPFFVIVLDITNLSGGCGQEVGVFYEVYPKQARYALGLFPPSDSLIRFSLYQRM